MLTGMQGELRSDAYIAGANGRGLRSMDFSGSNVKGGIGSI